MNDPSPSSGLLTPSEKQAIEQETNEAIGYLLVFLLSVVLLVLVLPAVLGGFLLYLLCVVLIKKTWSLYALLVPAVLGLLVLHLQNEWISFLGFLSWMDIAHIGQAAETWFNQGKEFPITPYSYLSLFSTSTIIANLYHPIVLYFQKTHIKTKEGEQRVKRQRFIHFKKHRLKYLYKEQVRFRTSGTLEQFIGLTEFKERVVLENRELNQHMLAVGTTGSGKTTTIATLIENAIRSEKPVIFVDGKGERKTVLEIKALCEAYGKTVHLFTDIDDVSFNPLRHGSPTQLRDKLMNLFEWSEPYYKNQCSRFLQLLLRMITEYGLKRDLHTVYHLMNVKQLAKFLQQKQQEAIIELQEEVNDMEHVPKEIDDISSLFEGMEEDSKEVQGEKKIRRIREVDPEKMSKVRFYQERFFGSEEEEDGGMDLNLIQNLRTQIAELLESDLGHLFEERKDGIDLLKITDRNEVVIFSLSGNKYRDYIKTLGRLVIMEVNTLVDHRFKQGKKSIFGVYDEFSAYANEEIVDVINKSRSAGFECLISTQGLSDIDKVDPVLTRQILNNCNTYFIGRVNDSQDASTLAETLGTYSDQEITRQVKRSFFFTRFESEMGTTREVQRFKAHPDEIKQLDTGEVFLARKLIKQDDEPYVQRVYVRYALDLSEIKKVVVNP